MSFSPQKRWPSRRFWLFTLGLCAAPLGVAWWRSRPVPLPPVIPYEFPTQSLEELDHAVQIRFAVVPDKDFGVNRIGPRHGYFSPITSQEQQAVNDLRKDNQEVVFYVVGRNTILRQQNWLSFSPVQGPIYITPNHRVNSAPEVGGRGSQVRFYSQAGVPSDSPTDAQLIKISRRVFNDPALREGTNGKINSWHVAARPVLATSEACVNCHNSRAPWKNKARQSSFVLSRQSNLDIVSLHDPLGIALYCYRSTRKETMRKLTEDELMATGQ
ncbi:hypothetical protein IAD21_02749 [Abditibacteriota bacterium]|nr:hypothetical protein IAD21_02749 [Abditibacteriota bacterium]